MSNKSNTSPAIRWQLLSTASAIALIASMCGTGKALAESSDADRPLIWIDLGGQMESVSGQGEPFAPHFLSVYSTSDVLQKVTPVQAQRVPRFGFGEYARISFQPENTDWVFSADIRYGRSSSSREVEHQTTGTFHLKYVSGIPRANAHYTQKFSDTRAQRSEHDAILDFMAGKDVGIGFLGSQSNSTIGLGVRFAQFSSSASVDIRARPDLNFYDISRGVFRIRLPYFHTYHVSGTAARGFHGVGPAVAWNSSVPMAGNVQDGEITIDWDVNAAVLFGRQKAHVRHNNVGRYVTKFDTDKYYNVVYSSPAGGHSTDRSITVPNVGGEIGLSWRIQNFKVSFGYRADLFMNAMDTGIDKRNSSNVLFHGPYASISIGLGD